MYKNKFLHLFPCSTHQHQNPRPCRCCLLLSTELTIWKVRQATNTTDKIFFFTLCSIHVSTSPTSLCSWCLWHRCCPIYHRHLWFSVTIMWLGISLASTTPFFPRIFSLRFENGQNRAWKSRLGFPRTKLWTSSTWRFLLLQVMFPNDFQSPK